MKKPFYLITTLLLSLSICNKVNAYCTEWEKNYFKEIESQYKATYDYDKNTGLYSITYYMPEPNLYTYRIAIKSENFNCESISVDVGISLKCIGKDFYGYQEFVIFGNSNTCNDELKKEIIDIPKQIYNKYSNSNLCEGIEEFVLCQKDYEIEITEDEFVSRTETYKQTKEKNKNDENIQNKENKESKNENLQTKNNIFYFFQNNLKLIIPIFILINLIIISTILSIKSIKKSRRLE